MITVHHKQPLEKSHCLKVLTFHSYQIYTNPASRTCSSNRIVIFWSAAGIQYLAHSLRSAVSHQAKHSVWDTWLFSSTERLQLVWLWERWSTVECDDDLLHTRALNSLFFLHLHLGLQGRVELIWIQHFHHLFMSRLSSLCLCPAVALSFEPFRASSDRYTLLSVSVSLTASERTRNRCCLGPLRQRSNLVFSSQVYLKHVLWYFLSLILL